MSVLGSASHLNGAEGFQWWEKKGSQVLRWLLFVVLVAILSFAIACLWQWLKDDPLNLNELLSGGEAFLVTIAITADAVGRAAESKKLHSLRALACCAVLAAALIGFVFTVSGRQDQKTKITSAIESITTEEEMISQVSAQMNDGDRLKADEEVLTKFNQLLAEEKKRPYDPVRIAKMSLILVCCGFVSSFLVILLEE